MNRHLVQRIGFVLLGLVALVVVVPILIVVGSIVVQGIGAIGWEFLTAMPRDGMKGGGIFPAIVGTLLLTLGTSLVAVPVGVGGAIYLSEYASDTWITRAIRLAIINLAGIPSVVHYPGDERAAHVPNESVKVKDLERGAVLYAETLDAYFGGG